MRISVQRCARTTLLAAALGLAGCPGTAGSTDAAADAGIDAPPDQSRPDADGAAVADQGSLDDAVPPPATEVTFNGLTAFARAKDGAAFDLPQFSLSLWVSLRHTVGSQVFIGRGAAGELFTLYLYQERIRMLVGHAAGSYAHASVAAPKARSWTHYLGTYDGKQIKLYVNGALKDTTDAPGRMPTSTAPLYIGALATKQRLLSGSLREVRVWSRALGSADAKQLAAGTAGASVHSDLVAAWDADGLEQGLWRNQVPGGPDAELFESFSRASGYHGIWYNIGTKYGGGLGTYCAKHRPFAIYAPKVDRTFFVYGGTNAAQNTLLHMVSSFDHKTRTVPRPTVLLDKQTTDAHDNPVIEMDDKGHLWVFSSSHGTSRPSYISRSRAPHSTEMFDLQLVTNFSYPQPWYVPGKGFILLHTRYEDGGRSLFLQTSPDGLSWSAGRKFARMERGHYQVTGRSGNLVGAAFNVHPAPVGLDARTNLYYMATSDMGQSWRTADGKALPLPLTSVNSPALVEDYKSAGRLVYVKDLDYDSLGHPIILYLTSGGHEPGPQNAPRRWQIARWDGAGWRFSIACESDHNYDMGELHLLSDSHWRLIAPTAPGPQGDATGGEVQLWETQDSGASWSLVRTLTSNSTFNHTYVRRPRNASPGFCALWADGDPLSKSASRLYAYDCAADQVGRLPVTISGSTAGLDPR